MQAVVRRHWLLLFSAIATMVIVQVVWWTVVFLNQVTTIAELKKARQPAGVASERLIEIANELFHSRIMFLSESFSFVLLTCFGLYLLYRALGIEERSRATQKHFVDILSHESKTPLTALKLRLESLIERPEASPLSKDLASAREEASA